MEWVEVPTEGAVRTAIVMGDYNAEDEKSIAVELGREVTWWINDGNNVVIDLRGTKFKGVFVEALKQWTAQAARQGHQLYVYANPDQVRTLEQVPSSPRINVTVN